MRLYEIIPRVCHETQILFRILDEIQDQYQGKPDKNRQ